MTEKSTAVKVSATPVVGEKVSRVTKAQIADAAARDMYNNLVTDRNAILAAYLKKVKECENLSSKIEKLSAKNAELTDKVKASKNK